MPPTRLIQASIALLQELDISFKNEYFIGSNKKLREEVKMENKLRFMAQELPEKEMEILYSLFGKGSVKNQSLKQKSCLWNWKNIIIGS